MKNVLVKLLLIPLVLATMVNLAQAQLSGTYTVGTGQDYTTLAAAANAAELAGINGDVVFEIIDGYSASEWIGFDYIAGTDTYSVTVRPAPGATSITLQRSSTAYAMHIGSLQNFTLDGADPSTGDKVINIEGIVWVRYGSQNITIKNVKIDALTVGITISNGSTTAGTCDNIYLEGNEIFSTSPSSTFTGISSDFTTATNISVLGNTIHNGAINASGSQVGISARSGLKAYNNLIHFDSDIARQQTGIYALGQDADISHNTIVIEGAARGNGTYVYGIDIRPGTHHDVRNNNIYMPKEGDSVGERVGIAYNDFIGGTYNIIHNNIYLPTDGIGSWGYFEVVNNDYRTDAAGVHEYAPNSTFSEPAFVDAANGNFDLTGASLTNPDLRGTPLAEVTDDFNGNSRSSQAPSKGAFEVDNSIADIIGFSFAVDHEDAVIDNANSTITSEVATGTNLSALSPTITAFPGASTNPLSGVTQDFSNPFDYTVTAEDGTMDTWTITVLHKNDAPTDISLDSENVNENSALNTVVGTFSTTDADLGDSHSYQLVAGDGDDDNGSFLISGDDLLVNDNFNFETKSTYLIRIESDDNVVIGGTYEKTFTISINDMPEAPTSISLDNMSVREGNPIGTVVGSLYSEDEDNIGDEIRPHAYTLVSGSGDSGNASFSIEEDKLVSAESFDFSQNETFSVLIRSTDDSDLFYEQSFTINVKSVAEGTQGSAAGDELKVTPTVRYSYDNFGNGVAISDGYAMIGARYNNYDENEENYVRDAGAAYVFENDGMGNWSQTQKITEPIRDSYNSFGEVIAMDGDYAVFGSPYASDPISGNGDGLLYVFEKDASGVWNFAQTLTASGSIDDGMDFGYAVDISGDYIVASALYDGYDENGANYISDAGAAYIYERDGSGVWNEVKKIVPSDRANDIYYFGESVAIDGNYLAVGAPEASVLATDGMTTLEQAGAIYLFERDGSGVWNEVAKLVASDREAEDYLGYTIALDGETLVAGNEEKDIVGGDEEVGAVYIFKRSGGVWEESTIVFPEDRFTEQGFGVNVRLSDGILAVNGKFDAVNEDYGIFIFTQDGDNWINSDFVTPMTYENSSQFGEIMDLDGKDIIVGEQYANLDFEGLNSRTNAGAAYFLELCENPDLPTIQASESLVCANSSVELSVGDASLNDAVSWQWFSASCGGTPVGSGPTITVTPTETTTYYVRGEGSCTNFTTCSFITIETYDECPFTDILTFSIPGEVEPSKIFTGEHVVDVLMPAGTNPTNLTPTFTISEDATSSPESGVAQDFTSSVIYTITAIDGTEQEWEVSVEEEMSDPTDIMLSSTSVDENSAPGAVVAELSVVDANFNETYDYYVVAVLEDDDWRSFDIDGTNLITTDFITLDFETKSSFTFELEVRDNNGGIYSEDVTITLNDVNEAPTDLDLVGRNIDESTPIGTVIGILSTTDEDSGDTHTYSYSVGCSECDPIGDEELPFIIVGNELRSNIVFDYETTSFYGIDVTTTDAGGLTRTEGKIITINDIPPQITSLDLSNQLINENENSGTIVGTLSTTGEDLSGSYTYTLVAGSGDKDNASFTLSNNELRTNASFDFESKDSYSIRVQTDDGSLTFEDSFTIAVGDVSEAPTDLELSANSIAENNEVNDIIGLLTTTDEDGGESYTYSLVAGSGDEDNGSFNINNNELRATVVFDFEVKSSYSVRVETNDSNGGTYQESFTISITDTNEGIVVVNEIEDQTVDQGFATIEFDLGLVFNDLDGDALTYSATSTNTSVATVSVQGATLTITEAGAGSAAIAVTADDGSGVTTSDEFAITVNAVLGFEDEIALEVYPNPTADFINIKSKEQLSIYLTDMKGQALQSGSGQTIRMDLRNLRPGVYMLRISNGESTSYKRIIKAN